jgi:hypothetical protein
MIAIILAIQILAGVLHLPFAGELRKVIFWLDLSLFHVGLIPSIIIYLLVHGKASRMIALTLIVYNGLNVIMECFAAIGYKELVTTLNSYYYSELILIILAFALCLFGQYLTHGICNSRFKQFFNFLDVLRGCFKKRKRN